VGKNFVIQTKMRRYYSSFQII